MIDREQVHACVIQHMGPNPQAIFGRFIFPSGCYDYLGCRYLPYLIYRHDFMIMLVLQADEAVSPPRNEGGASARSKIP